MWAAIGKSTSNWPNVAAARAQSEIEDLNTAFQQAKRTSYHYLLVSVERVL